MNKIVKYHYPAEKLPADLRIGIRPEDRVTVTVTTESRAVPSLLLDAMDAPDRPRRSKEEIDQVASLIRQD